MLDTITWGTYIFFAAFALIAFIFTFFCIPETRGKVRSCAIYYCLRTEKVNFRSIQTLEDMDLIFGVTSAHEEKERIKHIEADLRGTPLDDTDYQKPVEQHREVVDSV